MCELYIIPDNATYSYLRTVWIVPDFMDFTLVLHKNFKQSISKC